MQKIAILGSTGSIGTSALDVVSRFPERFRVSLLSTNSNIRLLLEQVKRFRPKAVCVVDIEKARRFKSMLDRDNMKVYEGAAGLCNMIKDMKIDTVLVGIAGSSALLPVLSALDNVKTLALANKEALVMAGDIIMRKVKRKKVRLIPVDSEHSAIFQCIESKKDSEMKRIYLTGSGGPLLNTPRKSFKYVTPGQAINHPKWKMGRKISIDSATLMNKGLEVIEAYHLFGIAIDRIKVLIHPQAQVHSMVEFVDGTILAQMCTCDMRVPIQYALTYPSRMVSSVKGLQFSKLNTLQFFLPDLKKFPCLGIAYEAARAGGTFPGVLNASNEVAVGEFLNGRIRFTDIPRSIQKVLGLHKGVDDPELEEILEADMWARRKTKELLNALGN